MTTSSLTFQHESLNWRRKTPSEKPCKYAGGIFVQGLIRSSFRGDLLRCSNQNEKCQVYMSVMHTGLANDSHSVGRQSQFFSVFSKGDRSWYWSGAGRWGQHDMYVWQTYRKRWEGFLSGEIKFLVIALKWKTYFLFIPLWVQFKGQGVKPGVYSIEFSLQF